MIDTIFSAVIVIGSIFVACAIYSALKGNPWAIGGITLWVCLMEADRAWAVREQSFIYNFLKGLFQ